MAARKMTFPVTQHTDSGHRSRHGIRPDIRDVDDLFPRRTACRCRHGRSADVARSPILIPVSRHGHASVDDGWLRDDDTAPATELFVDSAKRMLSHNDSPDLPFEQSLNPYRGCEHGCIYCYARPSHAFLGHSPGLDFETKLYHKPEAARLLRRELTRPDYVCRPIAIGTNTDAWQPVERRLRITWQRAGIAAELKHPAMLITKSALIERDTDLLAAMAKENLVHAAISLTTLDRELARRLEPRASAPQARLAAIRALSGAGVPVMVISPGHPRPYRPRTGTPARCRTRCRRRGGELFGAAAEHELHGLFERWLAWHAPEKASRVMAILYDMRGGKANDPPLHAPHARPWPLCRPARPALRAAPAPPRLSRHAGTRQQPLRRRPAENDGAQTDQQLDLF